MKLAWIRNILITRWKKDERVMGRWEKEKLGSLQ